MRTRDGEKGRAIAEIILAVRDERGIRLDRQFMRQPPLKRQRTRRQPRHVMGHGNLARVGVGRSMNDFVAHNVLAHLRGGVAEILLVE